MPLRIENGEDGRCTGQSKVFLTMKDPAHHQRLKAWLEAREALIQTANKTHILGDINIEGRERKR